MNPETVKVLASIVTAIIGTVLSPLVKLLVEQAWNRHQQERERRRRETDLWYPPDIRPPRRHRISWWWVLAFSLVLAVAGGFVGYYGWGTRLAGKPFSLDDESSWHDVTPVVSPTVIEMADATATLVFTPTPTPTPIPRGELLMEINFGWRGEGNCNDYNPDRLGYDNQAYYIEPPPNGYIAVCHENDYLEPRGSLQVSAFPVGGSYEGYPFDRAEYEIYGFGVLFGWKGGGLSTTDACIAGVRRWGGSTEAVFMERVNGHQSTYRQRVDWLALDDSPHTLRVVLGADRWARSYLDERFIAEHRFTQCSTGPIGLVAWGPGDLRVYFDDLKFFTLP